MSIQHRDQQEERASRLADFDYELPTKLIAQQPLPERDGARLLVVDRASESLVDDRFRGLGSYLRSGDLLVLNDTRVVPAKFTGRRATGGKVDGLFLRTVGEHEWEVLLNGAGRLRPGERIALHPAAGDELEFVRHDGGGRCTVILRSPDDAETVLQRVGRTPLPPYIHRDGPTGSEHFPDSDRYQTVFARRAGAVAAPTAGLHFTEGFLGELAADGIDHAFATLHVGLGTFAPVSAESLDDHRMHAEWYELPQSTAEAVEKRRAGGGRVTAVGTTSVRILEARTGEGGISAGVGWTNLFIRPPHEFRTVDALLTNFHLPRSTLLMLVAAFAGPALIRRAYRHAVEERYRFYSYGDAMLIV